MLTARIGRLAVEGLSPSKIRSLVGCSDVLRPDLLEHLGSFGSQVPADLEVLHVETIGERSCL